MKEIIKPWGKEYWITHNDKYAGKILVINKGCKLSKQYHKVKKETLYLIKGIMKIEIGDKKRILGSKNMLDGKIIEIEPNTNHRLEGITECVIIEFSTPELDDVVRLEDDYGRV